jgi:hypothetical protein
MSKSPHAPYTWEEIEDQIRNVILCGFSHARGTGPKSDELLHLILGIAPDVLDQAEAAGGAKKAEVLRSIPLERHHLHDLARNAYRYAYQLDGWEQATYEDHYMIDCGVLPGSHPSDMDGEPSPLSPSQDSPLRRVFETFVARWNLYNPDYSGGLSVRELALLSNMTVPAVRTSLSKEGIKLDLAGVRGEGIRRDDDRSATLNVRDALRWLEGRRGFVPNRGQGSASSAVPIAEIFSGHDVAFDQALRKSFVALGTEASLVARSASISQSWLSALVEGHPAEIEIEALRSLARTLHLPEADFVANGVRHLINIEADRTNS